MQLKFERTVRKILDDALAEATKSGKRQKLYIHGDGWIDFSEELPTPTATLICEINPTKSGSLKKSKANATWIRLNENNLLDVSSFWSVKLWNRFLIGYNNHGKHEFACDPELVSQELDRIYRDSLTEEIVLINDIEPNVVSLFKEINRAKKM